VGFGGEVYMNIDDVVFLGRDALLVTLLVSAPMLVSGMIVGLIISVFQSVTQIQEITLTFVPKILIVMVSFVLFLPWMASIVLNFVQPLFGNFYTMVR
jgi:flagellar biosynthetic protein FliQ